MDEHEREPDEADLSEQSGDDEELDFDFLEAEAAAAARGEGEREPDEDEEPDEDDGEDALESVTVEITGLSLYTHHGVSDAEREVGQRLVLDVRMELGEAGATATDRLDDTVDYAEVCQLVALIAQQRSYRTLERLCSSVADRLLADYA
ncbi:MAG: dihydroneopterin aldolase, partial [Solirubrobacteraceae bacterium]